MAAFQQPFQAQPPFPTYGHCDSYFVENHDDDDGTYAKAFAERERQRGMAKLRQKALADELSQSTAAEYQEDILNHMLHMEGETMPDVESINIQTEIQWFMRPYLLDFLLEAHHAFQLLPETLHLAVNILDRYCSRRVVYKRHYQLVGCAALLIAAKYGDRKERVPTIRELKSMCCSLYDDDMFTQMEWHVLSTLEWVIGHPTVSSFLQMCLTEVSFDPELEHMAYYFSEMVLYHKEFVSIRPSVMARCALNLARCILTRPQPHPSIWSAQYDDKVVQNICTHLAEPSQALSRKYAASHLSGVSTTIRLFLQRQQVIAQRVLETPIDQLHTIEITEPAYCNNPYDTPQTPHKPFPPMQVPAGILTPPITPDKDYCGMVGVTQPLIPKMVPAAPSTPSPPPLTADQQAMPPPPRPMPPPSIHVSHYQ